MGLIFVLNFYMISKKGTFNIKKISNSGNKTENLILGNPNFRIDFN